MENCGVTPDKPKDYVHTVYINGTKYTVEFIKADHPSLQGGSAIGLCNTTLKMIFINRDIPNIFDVLRHEITHAVIYEFIGVDVSWNSEKVCEFVQRYSYIITGLAGEINLSNIGGN